MILLTKVVAYTLGLELSEVLPFCQVSVTPGKFQNLSDQTSFYRRDAVSGTLDPAVCVTITVASADRSNLSLCTSKLKSTHLVLEYDLPILCEASLARPQNYTTSEKLQQGLRKISRIGILGETIAMRHHLVPKVTP